MKQDFAGINERGLVDQLEDRRLCKAKALGSNPSKSIWINYDSQIIKCTRQVMLPGKDGCAQSPIFGHYEIMYKLHIRRSLDKVRWTLVIMPSGGWLGSSADEGRAKLR